MVLMDMFGEFILFCVPSFIFCIGTSLSYPFFVSLSFKVILGLLEKRAMMTLLQDLLVVN